MGRRGNEDERKSSKVSARFCRLGRCHISFLSSLCEESPNPPRFQNFPASRSERRETDATLSTLQMYWKMHLSERIVRILSHYTARWIRYSSLIRKTWHVPNVSQKRR